jgi:hypothetical protein
MLAATLAEAGWRVSLRHREIDRAEDGRVQGAA